MLCFFRALAEGKPQVHIEKKFLAEFKKILSPTTHPQRPANDNGPHNFRCKRPQKRPKEQGCFVWR